MCKDLYKSQRSRPRQLQGRLSDSATSSRTPGPHRRLHYRRRRTGRPGVISILQTAVGLEPPAASSPTTRRPCSAKCTATHRRRCHPHQGRRLANDKMAAHTVGNTIYLPSGNSGKPLFNPDGSVSDYGRCSFTNRSRLAKPERRRRLHQPVALRPGKVEARPHGDRNFAYQYKRLAAGKPFSS